jgi:DNA-directed RNA polymerase subunit RPC12/RpoP
MASWTITCKNCGHVFAFSPISDSLYDYYSPEKPEFPQEGIERECPNCTSKILYQRHELVFLGRENKGITGKR